MTETFSHNTEGEQKKAESNNSVVSEGQKDIQITEEQQEQLNKKEKEKNEGRDKIISECKASLEECKKEIEQKENSEELDSFLNETLNNVIKNTLEKINSKDGIEISAEQIYSELLLTIEQLEKSEEKNNPYIKNLSILKQNFLSTPEDAIPLIDKGIKTLLGAQEKEENNDEYENAIEIEGNLNNGYKLFRNGVASLLDIGKSQSKDEMQLIVNDLKNSDFFKDITSASLEMESVILDLLSGVSKNTDKELILENLDTFFSSIVTDVTSILDGSFRKQSPEYQDSVKLGLINSGAKFLGSIINESNTAVVINSLENNQLVKNNSLLNSLIMMAKDPSLYDSETNKFKPEGLELIKLANEALVLFTDEIKMNDEFGIELDKYVTKLSTLLTKVSNNLEDQTHLDSIIGEIANQIRTEKGYKKGNNTLGNESIGDLEGYNSLEGDYTNNSIKEDSFDVSSIGKKISFLYDNIGEIWNLGNKKIQGEVESLDDAIKTILQSGTIEKNVSMAGGRLVERLQGVTGVEARKILLGIREQFLNNIGDITSLENNISENKSVSQDNEQNNFPNSVIGGIRDDIQNLIVSKYNSTENKNLSRKEISETIIKGVNEAINSSPEEFIKFLEGNGVKIEGNQASYLINLSNKLLGSPEMKRAIDNIISNGIHRIVASEEPLKEIEQVISDIANGNINSVMGEKTQQRAKEKMVESFYEVFLTNKESISSLVKLFQINIETDFNLEQKTLENLVSTIKNHLPVEKVISLLQNNKDILKQLDNPERIKQFSLDIYKTIEDKTGFIKEVTDSGILEDLKKVEGSKSQSILEFSDNDISKLIDSIYLTIDNKSSEQLAEELSPVIEKLGLNKLFSQIDGLSNSGLENSVNILKSIDKNKLTNFIIENKSIISGIEKSGKAEIEEAAYLAAELSEIVNMNTFQKLNDNVNGNEKFMLSITDEVQKTINSDPERFKFLTVGASKIIDQIKTGEDANIDIRGFSEDLFDFINQVVSQLDEGYIKDNLNINSESESEDSELMKKVKFQFAQEFLENNLGSSIGALLSSIGEKKWKEQLIDQYFRDKSKKQDFTDTISEALEDLK